MKDAVDQWITVLGNLVNPCYPAEAIRALAPLAPHIRAEFNASSLTPDMARACAEAKRFGAVPAWDTIAATIREHIRNARPITFGQLPAPRVECRTPPTPDEEAYVADLLKRHFAETAAETAPPPANLPDVSFSGKRLEMARENLVKARKAASESYQPRKVGIHGF